MKRISRLGMIALTLLALPTAGQSQVAPTEAAPMAAACPWLALGTASRLLGVSASVEVQSADGRSGSCLFVPTEGKPQSGATPQLATPQLATPQLAIPQLRLTVSTAAPQPCSGHARRLSGIGNEAEECWAGELSHAQQCTITGRVRNRWFALEATKLPSVSVRAAAPQWKGEPALPAPLEVAAEQVAGNLY